MNLRIHSYTHTHTHTHTYTHTHTHIYIYIYIQFLLRQAFADDEASTRLLQILLFLLLSTASLMFIPCTVRSSFTLSINFFGCLPLILVPSQGRRPRETGGRSPKMEIFFLKNLIQKFLSAKNLCVPPNSAPGLRPYSLHLSVYGSFFPSILVTCPNHVSLLFLILSTNVTAINQSIHPSIHPSIHHK